jgi:hypothetical protein
MATWSLAKAQALPLSSRSPLWRNSLDGRRPLSSPRHWSLYEISWYLLGWVEYWSMTHRLWIWGILCYLIMWRVPFLGYNNTVPYNRFSCNKSFMWTVTDTSWETTKILWNLYAWVCLWISSCFHCMLSAGQILQPQKKPLRIIINTWKILYHCFKISNKLYSWKHFVCYSWQPKSQFTQNKGKATLQIHSSERIKKSQYMR